MTNRTHVKPIKIAILAMGGEGGGVLADWIVDLAENNGYLAQTTSVPGVAQRTGATIYYVEIYPRERALADGGAPVFALMPMPGDVDIVLASELMEAGRAVQRGLVTPSRTTFIASTHRVYSIAEKSAMGDGRVDSPALLAHASRAAKRFVHFDMAQAAEQAGSVISAILFGALAATGTLPFGRAAFEATIERGGVGVKASLRAFDAAYARVDAPGVVPPAPDTNPAALPRPAQPQLAALVVRVRDLFAADVQAVAIEGVRRLIDYQDPAYADLYLDRLEAVQRQCRADDGRLVRETARHLALWMSYEDTIRVADLKTRATRFDRVRREVKVADDQLLTINEYMHPRLEEIAETLPAGLGRRLLAPGIFNRVVGSFTRSGRVIRTSSLRGYLMLSMVSGMRRWRRSTLRHHAETQRIEGWLGRIAHHAAAHPALALEIALCQRLVKGYSDTHARGVKNYELLMGMVDRASGTLSPAALRELRDAALADEHGTALARVMAQYAPA